MSALALRIDSGIPAPSHSSYYARCEHAWSYVGKLNLIARNLMNAAARTGRIVSLAGDDFPDKIKNITTHMKLLAIVSVPFSLMDLHATIQKVMTSLLRNDKEGVALGALSCTIIATDALDSITTFVNATLAVASLNPIASFSAFGLPAAFVMASLGTVSRTIQIAKGVFLYKSIDQIRNKSLLKAFLDEKLGDEIKKSALLRFAPGEAVKELEKLQTSLQNPYTEISKILEKVQALLQKKITGDLLGILANLFLLSAFVLFTLGSASASPFLLLATGFSIRVASLIYQDQILK